MRLETAVSSVHGDLAYRFLLWSTVSVMLAVVVLPAHPEVRLVAQPLVVQTFAWMGFAGLGLVVLGAILKRARGAGARSAAQSDIAFLVWKLATDFLLAVFTALAFAWGFVLVTMSRAFPNLETEHGAAIAGLLSGTTLVWVVVVALRRMKPI